MQDLSNRAGPGGGTLDLNTLFVESPAHYPVH